jgi:hypothetical protein
MLVIVDLRVLDPSSAGKGRRLGHAGSAHCRIPCKTDLKSLDYPPYYLRRGGTVPLLLLSHSTPKSGYLRRQWHEQSKVGARHLVLSPR